MHLYAKMKIAGILAIFMIGITKMYAEGEKLPLSMMTENGTCYEKTGDWITFIHEWDEKFQNSWPFCRSIRYFWYIILYSGPLSLLSITIYNIFYGTLKVPVKIRAISRQMRM